MQLVRKMQVGFGSAIAILLVVGMVSYGSILASGASDRQVGHTHEILENLESLLHAMEDVETGHRTFVLMGDERFLETYRSGVLRAAQVEKTIRTLTADNPNEERRLATLASLTEQKIQIGDALIRLRQTKGEEVAIEQIRGGQGIRAMEEIRTAIRNMEDQEHQLVSQLDAESERRSRQARAILILGSALGLLIAAGAGWTIELGLASRARAEEATRGREDRYRTLVESIRDYAIFMLDPEGRVVSWNAGAERYKGYRAEEIIGQNFSRFYTPEAVERAKPEEVLRMAAATGRFEDEGWRLRKDGSRFWAHVIIAALRDPSGTLLGFTEISRDISERLELDARYRGLLEAAPDAMVVVDQRGAIVLLNVQAEKQFGYRRDELVGQKVKNIIPEGFAERLIADGTRTAADALAQQIGTGIELQGRRKDGSEFPIEIMLSPLESAEGILVTAAIRDITLRKQNVEILAQKISELKRSNDELQQFAYVASHDLQEPLRMVASYTQLLASRYKGRLDSDADEFIAFAVDGSNRMQRLIQDLLAYSRAGTNGKALREISSENALKAAVRNLQAVVEESGAVVTHDSLPAITTNDAQLIQIFQNLVGNAIKYHGAEAPRVHVSAGKNGGKEWVFSVRDNGLGIDRQHFDRIFVLFQRLHGREEFSGTGIGLAICKKIVEGQGGRIWVESQPERGSTFHFALPEGDEN
jgi:PAS domain S-box-containing protein